MPGDPATLLRPEAVAFYRRALEALDGARVPFLVGGAFALAEHAGVVRFTKDLDLFLREPDLQAALDALRAAGLETEITFSHWLAKARADGWYVDLIHGSGNGVAVVDDAWFDRAPSAQVLGRRALLVPAEELLWSKAWVQERERYDGADVMHLLRARGAALDWQHVLDRFSALWELLLSIVVMYDFVYPADRAGVPSWVRRDLLGRAEEQLDAPAPAERVCRGTLLSRVQYGTDVAMWGYRDARYDLAPRPDAQRVRDAAAQEDEALRRLGGRTG